MVRCNIASVVPINFHIDNLVFKKSYRYKTFTYRFNVLLPAFLAYKCSPFSAGH